MNDWRLTNQKNYLQGENLVFKRYKKYRKDWDHDHCEFCMVKFMEENNSDAIQEGYTTTDNYRWICKKCYKDLKDKFNWTIIN